MLGLLTLFLMNMRIIKWNLIKIPLYSGGYNYSDIRQKKKALQQSSILDYDIKNTLKNIEILWIDLKVWSLRLSL